MRTIPDRIQTILTRYGESLAEQTRKIQAVCSTLDSSIGTDTDMSIEEKLENREAEISKLRDLIEDLNKALITTRRQLEYTLDNPTSTDDSYRFDSDSSEVQANVNGLTDSLVLAYNKYGTSAFMQYNTVAFFIDMKNDKERYSLATALCNVSDKVGLTLLPLWSDISNNNGQVGE